VRRPRPQGASRELRERGGVNGYFFCPGVSS
jgi:hypothetical protein